MMGFIYKYENKINHKVYIGQTTDLVGRKSSHRYKSTFVKCKFYNAVRKYGWDNFDFDIIAQVEEDTLKKVCDVLDDLEVKFIEEYDSFYHGYNSTKGGHCYRGKEVSEEFREYCRNRTYSDETRKKMSEAARNKVVSEETREKQRQNAMKRSDFVAYRKQHNDEIVAAIKKALSKPVLQMNEEGALINKFSSVKDAVEFIINNYAPGKTVSGITNGIIAHLHNRRKTKCYYGFVWKYGAKV